MKYFNSIFEKTYFPTGYFWKLALTIFIVLIILPISVFSLLKNQDSLYIVYFLLSFIFSSLIAYRFSLPIKRIALKALHLANKNLFYEVMQNEKSFVADKSTSEFFDLEQFLEQIRSKLKLRKKQIAKGFQEMETLMATIDEAVISIDQNKSIKFYNSIFKKYFIGEHHHFDAHSENNLFKLSDIVVESDIISLFHSAIENGRSAKIQKSILTENKTKERIFNLSVTPMVDQRTNEVYQVMGIFHDITEVKLTEKIKAEFVENASHELKTPLTSIIGYLDLLEADLENNQIQSASENARIVRKNSLRLASLVNDLLTLSKIENGIQLNYEVIDPRIISEDVIQSISLAAMKKKINIYLDVADVKSIKADYNKLEQVLINLLENAINYHNENGTIYIIWSLTDVGVRLSVKDNGNGIPIEHQERLFERFYRLENHRSRGTGGTGLGLAIVKHIVHQHGGTVLVKSSLGHGAEFICDFNVQK